MRADGINLEARGGNIQYGLLLLDLSYLAGAVAGYVGDQTPAWWTSDFGDNGVSLAEFLARVALAVAEQPGEVVGKHERALATLAVDLPETWRERSRAK